MNMANFLYPSHPLRCMICGPSCCGESVFVTNLILDNIKEFNKL